MTDNLRGALFMCLAMLGFGIEDALFKAAVGTGTVSPGQATVVFGVVAMTISALLARRANVPLWSVEYLRGPLLIRTAFEMVGRLFFALSLIHAGLATTSVILQAAPLVVVLGAALVLGEKVGPRRWAALGVGFVGVLMILQPDGDGFDGAIWLAILGMIGFAGRDLATRTSPISVHHTQLGVLGFAVVTTAGFVMMAIDITPSGMPNAEAALLMPLVGIVGVAAYTALTKAMRTGDVSVVAPFRYSRLIVALAIALLVFGERPNSMTLAGATLIVVSGLYTLWRDGRARRRAG